MADGKDVPVTVEDDDDEPHRISLELEEDEDEEPFVMETEELKNRMDKSHMPEAHPFEPDENAVWASRDPDVDRAPDASGRDTAPSTPPPAGPDAGTTGGADEEGEQPDTSDGRTDPERVRQKAFDRVAEKLREKGRSEEWIAEHEDAIWGRVDDILAE